MSFPSRLRRGNWPGMARTGTTLSVEKRYRNDRLLDSVRNLSGNNSVPNRTSSWDKDWTKNYGGTDEPGCCPSQESHSGKFYPAAEPVRPRAPLQ